MEKGFCCLPPFDEDLAAHITVTNHRGLCLFGTAISDVFPVVPKSDFIRSILADVESAKFGFEAILQYPVYVALNCCRTLAFLESGLILSKDEGGVWALQHLPASFSEIIEGALYEYRSGTYESNLSAEELLKFAAFIEREIGSESLTSLKT